MDIEIISIGNEVLSGFVANTNAAFISSVLLKKGLHTSRHTVLPDNREILQSALKESLARSQLVITTGGLGSTCDDITRNVAAELFESDFYYDEEVAADLRIRYGDDLPSLKDQSTIPIKARKLKNRIGTATGFVFTGEKSTLILLPGIPAEMQVMFEEEALPYMLKTYSLKEYEFNKRLYLYGLPESVVDIQLRSLQELYPHIEFGIYPGYSMLGVHFTVKAENEVTAQSLLEPPYKAIADAFLENVFSASSGKLEEAVHDYFISKNMTLAASESCTGGSFGARIVALPDASKYFQGSVVAYSDELKVNLLGVSRATLKEKGAVSEEVVLEMLKGVFSKTDADYGVAVTGIAGPSGGSLEKPVGTVWCAVGKRDRAPHVWKLNARGNRETIIVRSVNALLSGLLGYVKEA